MVIDLDDVTKIVGQVLGRRVVSATDRLMEDMGAESADILNIIVAVEDRYKISIEETAVPGIRTSQDLYRLVCDMPRSS